jgi:glycosyltransferase involved in cell wall biosynthesis
VSKWAKKVLVITHAGGSPHHGPNMRWYHLANALRDQSVKVEIVSATFFHKYFAPPAVSFKLTREIIDKIQYHWIRTSSYKGGMINRFINQIQFAFGCYFYAKSLADSEYDYIVASSPHPLVVFSAKRIAKLSNARLIFEIRDLWPLILNESSGMSPRHPYSIIMGIAESYGIKHSELVMSVKPGDFEYLQNIYKLNQKKFKYIPNGFLPGNRLDKINQKIEKLCKDSKFVIGYVGAISNIYEIEHLIKTAGRFSEESDIAFVIAGRGQQEVELQNASKDLNNVHFIGAVPNTAVPSLLSMFDACYVGLKTMPMNRFGISSNKIYEYMHASKPILGCYEIGYDPVTEASCGLVSKPGDVDALEASIRLLYDDKDLVKLMGLNARLYFDKNHDFKAVRKKLITEVFV